jgi:nucleotide-binding universal stress UspA family protein
LTSFSRVLIVLINVEATKIGQKNGGKKMIPQIRKILYATDLTKNSTYAFLYAADMARKHDAGIIILHCVEALSPSQYAHEGMTNELLKLLQKNKEEEKEQDVVEIKRLLQQFCQNMESQIGPPCVDLVSEIIVQEGHPTEEILNTANLKDCDIIVLGSHGKGWLKHTFLGSVATSVLERSRKPVFIIPLPSEKGSIKLGEL